MANWPHSPKHKFSEAGAYMVTASTYKKARLLDSPQKLDYFQNLLFELAEIHGWKMQAWAILHNHYHFIAISLDDPVSLKTLIQKLHSLSAREINKIDKFSGRKVWFQYWDTYLSFERSYLARLKYVNYNPVHHGVVAKADHYKWCSAGWFERTAEKPFYNTVMNFKIDKVNVIDDF